MESHHSYSKAFVTWAIEHELTSPRYREAINWTAKSRQNLCVQERIRDADHLKIFEKAGRRRGMGVVIRPIGDQVLKAARS